MPRPQYFFRYFANELKDRQDLPADTGECDVDGTGPLIATLGMVCSRATYWVTMHL